MTARPGRPRGGGRVGLPVSGATGRHRTRPPTPGRPQTATPAPLPRHSRLRPVAVPTRPHAHTCRTGDRQPHCAAADSRGAATRRYERPVRLWSALLVLVSAAPLRPSQIHHAGREPSRSHFCVDVVHGSRCCRR
eukprot:3570322-Prymnesium_polylepis.1